MAELTEEEIEKLFKEIDQIENENNPSKFDPIKNRDQTRSKIALLVVKFYFALIGLILVGVPLYNIVIFLKLEDPNSLALSVKDILSIVSGIISGPFGFVVGYYFKGSENS